MVNLNNGCRTVVCCVVCVEFILVETNQCIYYADQLNFVRIVIDMKLWSTWTRMLWIVEVEEHDECITCWKQSPWKPTCKAEWFKHERLWSVFSSHVRWHISFMIVFKQNALLISCEGFQLLLCLCFTSTRRFWVAQVLVIRGGKLWENVTYELIVAVRNKNYWSQTVIIKEWKVS